MGEPLDELYLKWLYAQVASVRLRNPARTYWSLMRLLYKKEFFMIVPNDDNRVEDGRDLRYEFMDENGIENDTNWLELECSFLEMLIGLSRRLSFESEDESRDWFWKLLFNLGLDSCADFRPELSEREISKIVDDVIYRRYSPDGQGGLFPLRWPPEDQRGIEIWYQMSHYLLEGNRAR